MKKHSELVSVVVPVYCVEPYLEKCVRSILAQTYKNLEIILINDGSPDRCPEICETLQVIDSRVKVVHKKNGGLSSARNAGLDVVSGDYITFIDSDDWIDPRYVEYLLDLACRSGSSIGICDLYDSLDKTFPEPIFLEEQVMSGQEGLKLMLYQTGFSNSASGKLFHTVHKKDLYFPEGKYHEDLWTIYTSIYKANTIAYGRVGLYCYVHHANSISHSSEFIKSLSDLIGGITAIESFARKSCPKLLPPVYSRKFSCCAQAFLSSGDDLEGRNMSAQCWLWMLEHRTLLLLDKNARLKNRAAALISFFGKKIFLLFYKAKGRKKIE